MGRLGVVRIVVFQLLPLILYTDKHFLLRDSDDVIIDLTFIIEKSHREGGMWNMSDR